MTMYVVQIHNQLQAQFSNMSDDFVRLQMDLDEQAEANAKLQAQLQKAGTDAQQLKAKHEKDITIITEELEDTKSVRTTNLFNIHVCGTHSIPFSDQGRI